jgi:hypothetical protein
MHGVCMHTAFSSIRAYTYKHTNTYKYTYLNRLAASGVSQFSFGVGGAAKAMILNPACMRRMPREERSFVVKPDLCVCVCVCVFKYIVCMYVSITKVCVCIHMILKPEFMRRMPREESSFVVKPDFCMYVYTYMYITHKYAYIYMHTHYI